MPILAEQNCTHWCFIFVLQLKKRHDLFDCIFALTARFIPVWLLRKSLFACIVLCLSIMRLTLSDTETFEKTLRNKKRGQLRKQPMENKHLSANAWREINVLRFSPRVDHVKLMWRASLYKHRTEQTERLYTPRKAQNDTVFIAARDKSLLFS